MLTLSYPCDIVLLLFNIIWGESNSPGFYTVVSVYISLCHSLFFGLILFFLYLFLAAFHPGFWRPLHNTRKQRSQNEAEKDIVRWIVVYTEIVKSGTIYIYRVDLPQISQRLYHKGTDLRIFHRISICLLRTSLCPEYSDVNFKECIDYYKYNSILKKV